MIAIASDHAGRVLKLDIMKLLDSLGLPYEDFGCHSDDSCDYPQFAVAAATAVSDGRCERGLLFCGTGIGISIAANKVKGIRCACCSDVYSAILSREHNDANMLALGARVVGAGLAEKIVREWLSASIDDKNPRHLKRIGQIAALEC